MHSKFCFFNIFLPLMPLFKSIFVSSFLHSVVMVYLTLQLYIRGRTNTPLKSVQTLRKQIWSNIFNTDVHFCRSKDSQHANLLRVQQRSRFGMRVSRMRMANVQLGLLRVAHASAGMRAHAIQGFRRVYYGEQQGATGLRFHHATQSAAFAAK
jgi:hypothetical protein